MSSNSIINPGDFLRGRFDEPLHVLVQRRAAGLRPSESAQRCSVAVARLLDKAVRHPGNPDAHDTGLPPWTHSELARLVLDELEAVTARYAWRISRGELGGAWRCLEAATDLALAGAWLRSDRGMNELIGERLLMERVRALVGDGAHHPAALASEFMAGATGDELDSYAADLIESIVANSDRAGLPDVAADLHRITAGIPTSNPESVVRVLTSIADVLLARIASNLVDGDVTTASQRALAAMLCNQAGAVHLLNWHAGNQRGE